MFPELNSVVATTEDDILFAIYKFEPDAAEEKDNAPVVALFNIAPARVEEFVPAPGKPVTVNRSNIFPYLLVSVPVCLYNKPC